MLSNLLYSSISIYKNPKKIGLNDRLFFIGSCFSENIHNRLNKRKINSLSNPYGIMFDTLSIENTISEIVEGKVYKDSELFLQNELYGSLAHHTDFSFINKEDSLEKINSAIVDSRNWIMSTSQVIITLGSAYSYFHHGENRYVANCHKIPQTEFRKDLIPIERIISSLKNIRELILSINPSCNFILTISPVRHLRDGLVENNRSKARLIEAVNQLTNTHPEIYYFPSYEIVIDVLRDYRFFDIDFAHPNYLATDIVFDFFKDNCIDPSCFSDLDGFHQLYIATKHRSRNPETKAHKKFLEAHLEKAKTFQEKFPDLDFTNEIDYFSSELEIRS